MDTANWKTSADLSEADLEKLSEIEEELELIVHNFLKST
jgi:hypothetical protein